MQVSANVTERHNYAAPGVHKFFGDFVVDGARFTFEAKQTPEGFDCRYERGEYIVRREIRDAIFAACAAFAS